MPPPGLSLESDEDIIADEKPRKEEEPESGSESTTATSLGDKVEDKVDVASSDEFHTPRDSPDLRKLEITEEHEKGECRPCAYFWTKADGCHWGDDCKFCHLCDRDELKKRKKEKRRRMKAEAAAAAEAAAEAAEAAEAEKKDSEAPFSALMSSGVFEDGVPALIKLPEMSEPKVKPAEVCTQQQATICDDENASGVFREGEPARVIIESNEPAASHPKPTSTKKKNKIPIVSPTPAEPPAAAKPKSTKITGQTPLSAHSKPYVPDTRLSVSSRPYVPAAMRDSCTMNPAMFDMGALPRRKSPMDIAMAVASEVDKLVELHSARENLLVAQQLLGL